MTEETVVKMQRALFPPGAPALIYDHAREHLVMAAMPPLARRLMGSRNKAYFAATWDAEANAWTLHRRVESERW